MRPDPHKQRESRRWQQRKQVQQQHGHGDERDAAAGRSAAGNGTAGGGRDGGLQPKHDGQEEEDAPAEKEMDSSGRRAVTGSRYSRRKVVSNVFRYDEPNEEEQAFADAKAGVDKDTAGLLSLIESAEQENYNAATYFQLKEERDWSEEQQMPVVVSGAADDDLLGFRFKELEESLGGLNLFRDILGLDGADAAEMDEELSSGRQPPPPLIPIAGAAPALPLTLPVGTAAAAAGRDVPQAVTRKPTLAEDNEDMEALFQPGDRKQRPLRPADSANGPSQAAKTMLPTGTAPPNAADTKTSKKQTAPSPFAVEGEVAKQGLPSAVTANHSRAPAAALIHAKGGMRAAPPTSGTIDRSRTDARRADEDELDYLLSLDDGKWPQAPLPSQRLLPRPRPVPVASKGGGVKAPPRPGGPAARQPGAKATDDQDFLDDLLGS